MKKFTSTGWIIVAFIIFFPIGIILLALRLHYDSVNNNHGCNSSTDNKPVKPGSKFKKTSTIFLIIGIVSIVSALGCAPEYSFSELFPAFIVGITFIVLYLLRKRTFESYRKYLDYFAFHPVASIQQISIDLGIDQQSVRENVASLIHKKILDAYVTDDGQVALCGYDLHFSNDGQRKLNKKTIKCPSCGAPNEIYEGISSKCKYCDAPLNW